MEGCEEEKEETKENVRQEEQSSSLRPMLGWMLILLGLNPRPSARPGNLWPGSNPRQMSPCRSHGGFAIHCATDAPLPF
ncbi:hypothetical protein PoB_004207200 [Plakobranchus ocellatus]|uniref:Uncharacterized protein n=1 Tax=Plakobranchus ocellatus TaxID=259542 RepID=A0AAV4B8R3_9GAST|nr:hypothetical protein PoB_004207200 [Plakobranchus ocellatus]